MRSSLPLFPEQGSRIAAQVDELFLAALAVSVFFSALIFCLIVTFAIRYRRRHPGEVGRPDRTLLSLEITWTAVPLAIALVLFFWGARVFYAAHRPPADATEFFVIGKQWMWKIQHLEGNREINELHVPVGRPVKLTMTSEDVIHSFFVPAFRVKQDVLPGRYTTLWFEATRPGTFALYCAEYCGAEHSRMIGRVVVLPPHDYQRWLDSERPQAALGLAGRKLFSAHACDTCHRPDAQARAPLLLDLYGSEVRFADGSVTVADDNYLRESILDPMARIVAGYPAIMPTYRGRIAEEDLRELLLHIRGLTAAPGEIAPAATPAGTATPPQEAHP